MFQRGRNRFLPALALTAVLALALTPPAGAAGWSLWREEGRELAAGFFAHVLDLLGITRDPGAILKCGDPSDQGASIDPNGCPKATTSGRPQPTAERSELHGHLRSAGSRGAY
jgi:hypothetical protein